GFTAYSLTRLSEQLAGWVERGIPWVKMKVGSSPDEDPGRVRAAREAIGPEAQLFVDANGAYSRKQALELAERFRTDAGGSWVAGGAAVRHGAPAPDLARPGMGRELKRADAERYVA